MTVLAIGNGSIQIPPDRDAYNILRLKYQGFSENAKKDFLERFAELFSDMDQLHVSCTNVAQQYLVVPIDEAIRDLVANGVMDIDDEHFSDKYLLRHITWEHDFNEIDDKYLSIVLRTEQLDQHRKSRRENRGGIFGGGFGFEGAAQGAAMATAANVALDVAHGIINLGGKALSAMGDGVKKSNLYNDPQTKAFLAESIYRLVFQVHLALVDAALDRLPKSPYLKVSDEDSAKAKSLFVNINKGRIVGNDAENLLIESLALNPYEPTLYFLWLDRYGDVDGHLAEVAKYFGVHEVSARKKELILRRKESLKFSTVEEYKTSLACLESYACSLNCQYVVDPGLLADIDRLDRERRTFNGILFDTSEDAQAAQSRWKDELRRTYNGTLYETLEAAQAEKLVDDEQRMSESGITAQPSEAKPLTREAKRYLPEQHKRIEKQSRATSWLFLVGFVVMLLTAVLFR